MPAPKRWILPTAMRLAGTRPPAEAMRRGLCAGLREDVVERVVAEFTPESLNLYQDETGIHAWPGRRGFLLTSHDKELAPGLQRRFAQRLGAQWSKDIATGHLPMLQNPAATATAIRDFLTA